jgi:hypothetical protein
MNRPIRITSERKTEIDLDQLIHALLEIVDQEAGGPLSQEAAEALRAELAKQAEESAA